MPDFLDGLTPDEMRTRTLAEIAKALRPGFAVGTFMVVIGVPSIQMADGKGGVDAIVDGMVLAVNMHPLEVASTMRKLADKHEQEMLG